MNPAHLLIASLVLLAAFWLGYWFRADEEDMFVPTMPAIILNISCATGVIASVCQMVAHFLTAATP